MLGWLERLMIRGSRVVIVICPDLELTVKGLRRDVPIVVIENAPGSGTPPVPGTGAAIRRQLGVAPHAPVVLYTGTFESYQGLDLLFAAMPLVLQSRPDATLVMVGGAETQVASARKQTDRLGLGDRVIFTGQRPAEEIPAYLDAATLLVSPRSTGTNTPLKIYQYLRSGRPIVATNLRTHTQVLSADTAFLADPTPEGFAATILEVLHDPDRAVDVGRRARELADAEYSDEAYIAKTRRACDLLAHAGASLPHQGVA
jgi:glycosyltransferase involved in cell wall biosynthesis